MIEIHEIPEGLKCVIDPSDEEAMGSLLECERSAVQMLLAVGADVITTGKTLACWENN